VELMLCDGYNHGYHFFCLCPILSSVPASNWFYDACRSLSSSSSMSSPPPGMSNQSHILSHFQTAMHAY
jgi:hypothetical protein